ncbi:hypothetical protein H2248_008006 [Termitomyces sp. 'cryptogamus']|nr:hypothetical protein H2248_008006 [Termitomyces sp. 'cryptogamus']
MQSPCSVSYLTDLVDVVALSAKWLVKSVYEESKMLTAPNGIKQAIENTNTVENAFGQQLPDFGTKDLFQRQYQLQSVIRSRVFGDNTYYSLDPCVFPARLLKELVNERTEYSHHPWKKHFDKITFALVGLVYFVRNWQHFWRSLSKDERKWIVKHLNQNFFEIFTQFDVQWNLDNTQDLNQRTEIQLLPCVTFIKLWNGLELDLPIRDQRFFLHFSTLDGTPLRTTLELKYLPSSTVTMKRVLKWEAGKLEITDP